MQLFFQQLIAVFCSPSAHDATTVCLLSHRSSLSKDAKDLFDSDTGVLEVPMAVEVAGQVCITATRCSLSHRKPPRDP